MTGGGRAHPAAGSSDPARDHGRGITARRCCRRSGGRCCHQPGSAARAGRGGRCRPGHAPARGTAGCRVLGVRADRARLSDTGPAPVRGAAGTGSRCSARPAGACEGVHRPPEHRRVRALRRGQGGRRPRRRRAANLRAVPPPGPRSPPVREMRQDRLDRGARRDGAPDISATATGCPAPSAASAAPTGNATSLPATIRSARHARRGPWPAVPAAARTARPRPAGPKGRSAIRATPPRCGTGHHAHPAGSCGGSCPRPARAPRPAPPAPASP